MEQFIKDYFYLFIIVGSICFFAPFYVLQKEINKVREDRDKDTKEHQQRMNKLNHADRD